MLKIKDNVNLKELEKFDELEYKPNEHFQQPYYVNNSGTIIIFVKSRHLELIGCSNVRNEYDVLFDLIKADMVEKVVDMSKTEYAWVIQRDDGKFINFDITNSLIYPDGTVIDSEYSVQENVYSASMAWSKHRAEYLIESYELNNCRPVKVKIEIVGEADGN